MPILLLAGVAAMTRSMHGSWFSPGPFFAMLWTFFMLLPLVGAPDYPVSYESTWLIFLFVAIMLVGVNIGMSVALINRGLVNQYVKCEAVVTLKLPFIRLITAFMCLMGVLCTVLTLYYTDVRISELFSVEGWVGVAEKMSVLRYLEKYTDPFVVRLLLIGFYGGGLFGGVLFKLAETRLSKAIGVLPLLVAVVYTMVTTAKAAFLFTVIMWVSSYITLSLFVMQRKLKLFTVKNMRLFLSSMAVIMLLFTVAIMGRAGSRDLSGFDEVYNPMRSYFFSYLPAFSKWLEVKGLDSDDFSLGQYTFAGVFEASGLGVRKQGLYVESVDLGEHQESNIYTVFRGLIMDFSLLGAAVFLFVLGYISGFSFRRVILGGKDFIPLLVLSYMFLLWSPVTSIYNYNSIVAGLILFSVYMITLVKRDAATHGFDGVQSDRF